MVAPGTSVVFTCTTSDNFEGLEYEFYKDGIVYHHATEPDFTLPGEERHSGVYTCKVMTGRKDVVSEESNGVRIEFAGICFFVFCKFVILVVVVPFKK